MSKNIMELCNELTRPNKKIEDHTQMLIELKAAVSKEKNKRTVIRSIGEYFFSYVNATCMNALVYERRHYINVGDFGMEFLTSKILSNGYMDNGIKIFNKGIDSIINFYQGYTSENTGSGELIPTQKIDEIMSIEFVSKASRAIAANGEIFILSMDYTGDLNSISMPHMNTIINTRPNYEKNGVCDTRYIFMHELGHLFSGALTGISDGVVDSMDALIANGFNADISNIPPEYLPEIFADCFAIACAHGTEYESVVPFYESFNRSSIDYISQYMRQLLDDYIKLESGIKMKGE